MCVYVCECTLWGGRGEQKRETRTDFWEKKGERKKEDVCTFLEQLAGEKKKQREGKNSWTVRVSERHRAVEGEREGVRALESALWTPACVFWPAVKDLRDVFECLESVCGVFVCVCGVDDGDLRA